MPETHTQFTPEQRVEIKGIVHEALVEYFKGLGTSSRYGLITIATIIGAITVIFGGVKTLLAWIGFSYINN